MVNRGRFDTVAGPGRFAESIRGRFGRVPVAPRMQTTVLGRALVGTTAVHHHQHRWTVAPNIHQHHWAVAQIVPITFSHLTRNTTVRFGNAVARFEGDTIRATTHHHLQTVRTRRTIVRHDQELRCTRGFAAPSELVLLRSARVEASRASIPPVSRVFASGPGSSGAQQREAAREHVAPAPVTSGAVVRTPMAMDWLTEQVMRAIDRRVIVERERRGGV